jgi:flagellar biosynthesis anti-sigma factor FlgM
MRIDGNRPNSDEIAAQKLERALAEGGRAASGAPQRTAGGDRVELSADAALAQEAVKAAAEGEAIRPEVVERARRLLAEGKLGSDAHALADSLIESMLERIR